MNEYELETKKKMIFVWKLGEHFALKIGLSALIFKNVIEFEFLKFFLY